MTKIELGKLRGTRVMMGAEAEVQRKVESDFRRCLPQPWL